MTLVYIGNLKIYILFLLFITNLHAGYSIDISKEKKHFSLLESSEVYFDRDNNKTLKELLQQHLFKPYTSSQINTGIKKITVWIKIQLDNPSSTNVEKILILTSPLLEQIELYNSINHTNPLLAGVKYIDENRIALCPNYKIQLKADKSQEYYIKVKSKWTPVNFKILLKNKRAFQKEDLQQQLVKAMLLAMIIILMIYSFILSFYAKDKGYLYYSLYLLTLIYQQGSYLGLNQLYLPMEFVSNIEIRMANTKISLMIISSSLFSIYFLKTKSLPHLHKIYKGFILIALFEITILNIPSLYTLKITILTSALLIIFNIIASIISYRQGNQQARLFILGFSIVFVSYSILISNALGLISIVQHIPNTLIWGTTFEALILSLAFVDRYRILQKQKEESDKNREETIKKEVILKTAQLNKALKVKSLLLREVHHRVKNNLQIILSMIRLQSDKIKERKVKEKFTNIENRINAIAKTYNMLIVEENLEDIDMEEYIEALLSDIEESLFYKNSNIHLEVEINASLPLRKAVYIGIIINELVTNSYKYAFDGQEGKILLKLYQEKQTYRLIIQDNGKGFIYNPKSESLGLKLIQTLIIEQLKGTLKMQTLPSTKYKIEFR
jgi:two-component sensor histidine kinase